MSAMGPQHRCLVKLGITRRFQHLLPHLGANSCKMSSHGHRFLNVQNCHVFNSDLCTWRHVHFCISMQGQQKHSEKVQGKHCLPSCAGWLRTASLLTSYLHPSGSCNVCDACNVNARDLPVYPENLLGSPVPPTYSATVARGGDLLTPSPTRSDPPPAGRAPPGRPSDPHPDPLHPVAWRPPWRAWWCAFTLGGRAWRCGDAVAAVGGVAAGRPPPRTWARGCIPRA